MADTRNSNEPKTIVIFREWKDPAGHLIAIFPENPGTNDPFTCDSYENVGQHGSCSLGIIANATRPARPGPKLDALREELRSIGYNLDERKRVAYAMNATRRAKLGC